MNLLLDTHVWIWAAEDPGQLGKTTVAALSERENELFVSTISTLEIARLIDVGRIRLKGPLESWIGQSLASLRCTSLEVSHEDAIGAYSLPGNFHRDPADRLLASTARNRGLTLVTADRRILDYNSVETLDARS